NFMSKFIKSLHHKSLTTKNKAGQAPDLNVQAWKEFTIPELFGEVKIAKSADIGNLEEGNTPFVGRTDVDNGVQGFVTPVSITEGKCITISMVGTNVALYQEQDFQASQNIAVLRNSFITKEMALFICSMINFEMRLKYSYGRTVGKMNIEQMVLKLPVDSDGNPDWQFMENYIKALPYGDRLEA
ncbi:MAG: restriction endonuclease subunit S, partial [Verrucomicrobia bacterium]|nr:restriction endonuclease subunit S [Verrucomicrobiota bacterium]